MATREEIVAALQSLRPSSEWKMSGDTLADVQWISGSTKPTQQEIDAEVTRLASVAATEAAREAEYVSDAGRIDLMDRLKTATVAQIDAWIDANVTSLAAARAVLKAIVKVIALDRRN